MQTIGIKTAQNIDIDYEVAGLGERIIARIIDYVLFVAVYLIYIWIFGSTERRSVLYQFTLPEIIYFVFYIFYDIVTEVLFNGQSLGKYIMKIRVISIDGGRPRLGQYLLRYVFRLIDFLLTLQVGAIVAVAVTDNKQRIGDIVANTTLIKTKPRTGFNELYNVEVEDDYQPVFLNAGTLPDSDIALIHEVTAHFYKTGDMIMVDSMANRIKKKLDISIPAELNNYQFLKTILKDHHYASVGMGAQIV